MLVARWTAVAFALFLGPSSSAAQASRRIEIADEVACPVCRVERTATITLSSRAPEGELSELPFAVRAIGGRELWVLSNNEVPRVYESGKFVRAIGRSGRGPGEYLTASDAIALPGDSVLVVDADARRVTVLDRRMVFVRSIPIPAPLASLTVQQWPKEVLFSARIATPTASAFPVHMAALRADGLTLHRSFGPPRSSSASRALASHHIARLADGTIVTADPAAFEIHLWSPSGAPIKSFLRRPNWFADSSTLRSGTPSLPPSPSVLGIGVDADNRIWVFIRRAAREWRSGWGRVAPGAREVSRSTLDHHRLFETVVEVIDPIGHRVMARAVLEGLAISPSDPKVTPMWSAGPEGDPVVAILQLALRDSR